MLLRQMLHRISCHSCINCCILHHLFCQLSYHCCVSCWIACLVTVASAVTSPVLSAVLSLLCQLLNRLSCHCCVSCYIACPFSCLITVASAGLYNSTVTVASAVVLPILSAFLLIVLQRKLLIPMNPYRTFLYISLQNNAQRKYFVTYEMPPFP